jgi:hypothetical protein
VDTLEIGEWSVYLLRLWRVLLDLVVYMNLKNY